MTRVVAITNLKGTHERNADSPDGGGSESMGGTDGDCGKGIRAFRPGPVKCMPQTQYSRSPVGHWTKIEVGRKITPPPLIPELSGRETVDMYVRERLPPELAELAAETPAKVEIPLRYSPTPSP